LLAATTVAYTLSVTETLITDRRSQTGTYKILRRLGKGGMAEVFLARQEGLAGFRRLTVVKKLLPQFSQVQEVAEMLLDEARIAAQLTHPNIVQIFELGKDEGQYFIAMEYVDGCDLATLARIERHRQSRVPLRLTLRIVSEAAMGLDFAHRQTGLDGRPLNIVHRDVSPHNIICSREGAVKVTDFGIAKAVGKALVTQVGVVKGKVQYMSPEQYTGATIDRRSDLYSLGVVLYQLTTGKLPRVAKDGGVAMRRVVEGAIPRPSDLRADYPEELEGIVMRALAHNPDERYPDAASLREDLLDFARENDLLAFPKELGEYVNALVPPIPLVVREQSRMSIDGQPPSPGSAVIEQEDLPAVMVEGEEEDTDSPPGTEVASPGARRRIVSNVGPSDPYGETEIPIDHSTPALVSQEGFTPSAAATPVRPSREPSRRNGERPRSTAPPRGNTSKTPASAPALTEAVRPRQSSAAVWLSAAAVLVAMGSLAALVYVFAFRGSAATPPGPGPGPDPNPSQGAGVINVLANPPNASVSIDGARRCPSTPCQVAGLPLNRELVLTVKSKGYELWMQRLVLTTNEPKLLLRADLTPQTQPEPTAPTGRHASADDAGKTPQPKKKPRHRPPKGPKASKGQAKSEGQIVTTAIPAEVCLLAVDVRPWAEVWVDGKKVGHTPLQVQLPPGMRRIELKNPDLKYVKTFRRRAKNGTKIKISEAIQPPGQPPPGQPPSKQGP
jgi:serine/threonine protein kinase